MNIDWSERVYFRPYVGPDYEAGLVNGLRVLLLGESHYAGDPETEAQGRNCTIDTFSGYLTCDLERGNTFFGKLQRIVTRDQGVTAESSRDAWRRVAYANLVQEFVGNASRQRPTNAMWATGQPALSEMIGRLKPHAVLVLGSAAWSHITDGRASPEPDIQAPRSNRSIWLMPHSSGHAKATWIYHPATGYDSTATAIGIFSELLERCLTRRG